MDLKIGLRERKSVKTKVDLMNAMIKRLTVNDYASIRVEDLCKDAMVSKVTFFKYFPSKDDLFELYFSYLIAFQNLSIRRGGLEGLNALRKLFENMGQLLNEQPTLTVRLLSYMVQRGTGKRNTCLSEVELQVLFPDEIDLSGIDSTSLGKVLREQTAKAFEAGALKPVITESQFVLLVSALFHGSGPTGLRVETENPGRYYLENFDNLIKIINQ